MKNLFKIIPFILIFCLLFSPISYAATGSGEFNPFIEGFPLNEDISLYNSVDTPYLYNFYSDTESLIVAAINSFGNSKNYVFDINDIQYILFYKDKYNLQLLFWDKSAVPEIEFNVLDSYNQLMFIPSVTSGRDDNFRFGFIQMYCGSSSSEVRFTSSHSTSTYASAYLRWYPESDINHEYQPADKGWFTQLLPVCQRGAELPFVFQDSTYYLFDNTSVGPEEPSEDDIVIPDIPEDTDSSIVTLIKSIASFFGQLFSKLNSLFSSLITKVGFFFNNLFSGISDLFSDIKDFLSNILNDIISGINNLFDTVTNIYDYLTDTDISFGYFFSSEIYKFIEQIIEIKDRLTFADVSPDDSVSFELDFTKSNSFLSSVGVVLISFDWYLPYRSAFSTLLLVFVYAGLGFRFFKELPSLISGHSGEESGN